MSDAGPSILVVVRASPIRERTLGLLESITLQKAAATTKVVVLTQRTLAPEPVPSLEGVAYVPAEPDWTAQALRLAATSGCRWLVLPSSVDRYLAGAFEAVVELGAAAGRTVVGVCQAVRDGRIVVIGPTPFRFDYFALLSGFNYIAPGATFIDIGQCLQAGGFDPRFPSCPTYEYLLRTAAADGVDCCPIPIVETEVEPFPGVPDDWVALYASEALLVTLNYNRFFVTPGASLGLLAALADRLEPYAYMGFHDPHVLGRLAGAAADLKQRYVDQLRIPMAMPAPADDEEESGSQSAEPVLLPTIPRVGFKSRVKRVTPRRVWDMLRRGKRAYQAFRSPLY